MPVDVIYTAVQYCLKESRSYPSQPSCKTFDVASMLHVHCTVDLYLFVEARTQRTQPQYPDPDKGSCFNAGLYDFGIQGARSSTHPLGWEAVDAGGHVSTDRDSSTPYGRIVDIHVGSRVCSARITPSS